LKLTSEVSYTAVEHSDLDGVACFTCAPLIFLQEVENTLHDLEVGVLWVARYNDHVAENRLEYLSHLVQIIDIMDFDLLTKRCDSLCFSRKMVIHCCQYGSQQGVCLANQAIKKSSLCCHLEQDDLLVHVLKSWNSDMTVGNASLDKTLGL